MTEKKKPQLPKRIKIHGVEFDVKTDEEARAVFLEWDQADSLGFFVAKKHMIAISPDQPDLAKGDTSLHELLHAIWWQVGIRTIVDDDELEEKIVSLLSGPLFDTLRRNPEYVEYLMSLEGNG